MIVGKIGDTSYDKQMLLALIIGVVHICIAMTVKAIGATVRYGFKAVSYTHLCSLFQGFPPSEIDRNALLNPSA